MELTHSFDDRLASLFIALHLESRVFFRETLKRFAHFFAISLGLRLNSHRDNGFGETRWLKGDLQLFIPEGIASSNIL